MMSIHYSNTNSQRTAPTTTNGKAVRGRTESPPSRYSNLGTYDSAFTAGGGGGPVTKTNLLSRRTPSQQQKYYVTEQQGNDDYLDTAYYEEDSFIKLNNNRSTQPLSSNSYGVKRNALTGQQGIAGFQLQSLNNTNNTNYIYNHSSLMQQPNRTTHLYSTNQQQQQQKPSTLTQRPRVGGDFYSYNTSSKVGGNTSTSTVGIPKYTHSIVTSNSAELIHKNLDNLSLNDSRHAYQDSSTSQMGTGYANSSKNNFARTRRSQFNLFDGNNNNNNNPTTSTTTNKPMMNAYSNGSGSYVLQHQHQQQQQQHLQSNMYAATSKNNVNASGGGGGGGGITQFYANQYQQPAYKTTTTTTSVANMNHQQNNHLLPSPSSTSSSSSSSPPLQTANNGYNGVGYTSYGGTQFYVNSNNNAVASNYGGDIVTRGIVGLKNLGNTCFMNSILQCLSNTRCLLEYCLSGSYNNDINTTMSVMKGALFNSYASLIKKMWKNEDMVSPKEFKDQIARFAPRFVGYAQQDAEEFLYYLVKGLHEDVNLIRKKPTPVKFDEKAWDRMNDQEKSQKHWSMNMETDTSRISDMFVGQLKSTLKCTECNYKSPTFELFWHLAVPIPKKSSIDLHDCLSQFMLEEVLKGDNMPFCSRCKEKRCCTKRYTIERLPNILVIHLKRFLKVRFNNKINLNVDYPIEGLDMSRYLSQNVESSSRVNATAAAANCLYDLYGISLHSGTESSGHYVAYAKHPYNHKWHCFNDSIVREIPYSALQDANAYILFYQLRS